MHPLLPLLWFAAAPGSCLAGPDGEIPSTTHDWVARDLRLDVEDGAALLTLSDRLRPEAAGVALSSYGIELPRGRAVVVDAWLSSRHGTVASKVLRPDEADGDFDAFEAALLYGSSADAGPRRRGRPQAALLVQHDYSGVIVRVAAPCGLGVVDVHLRVRLASDPVDDEWRFELPTTADLKVRSLAVPGRFWRRQGDATVVVERRAEELRGRVATVRLPGASERHVLRAELDLPRRFLEERPLAFVFVLDRSVSFGADRLRAAARLVEEMLALAPAGSTYAVVTVERYPRVVVSPGTPAASIAPLRALAAEPDLANGSDVVAALGLAKRVAADAGEREGRVVLLSDLETATHVHDGDITLALARGRSLTHVVKLIGEGTSWWSRSFAEDGHAIAAGAEASGGVLVEGSLLLEQPDAELAAYLVRPTRLERPRLVGSRGPEAILDSELPGGLTTADLRSPWLVVESVDASAGTSDVLSDHLPEGGGFRVTGVIRPLVPVGELSWSAHGHLWGTPARYPLADVPASAQLLPAIAAVNEVSDSLDDAAVLSLAQESGAVSRVTSRLALPSWRPAPRDAAWGGICGCSGGSFSGSGTGGTSCTCRGDRPPHPYDRVAEIEAWLAAARDACGASGASMRLEYGSQEVLNVSPLDAFGAAERCYTEALWSLRLDESPDVTAAAYAAAGEVVVRLPE